MELLLNVCCLLLIVPGAYLWRTRKPHARAWRLAIALVCLFFLLLPVISATDDLHAVSQEMEDSTPRKWSKGGGAEHTFVGTLALLLNSALPSGPSREVCGRIRDVGAPILPQVYAINSPSRAPPCSSF